jgi:hypothetical protein
MTNELYEALKADGYSAEVAEALAENDITVEQAASLSKQEVLNYYLTWNGIHGYTDAILRVIDCAERNCNM